jgi:GPI inositol-deacylase
MRRRPSNSADDDDGRKSSSEGSPVEGEKGDSNTAEQTQPQLRTTKREHTTTTTAARDSQRSSKQRSKPDKSRVGPRSGPPSPTRTPSRTPTSPQYWNPPAATGADVVADSKTGEKGSIIAVEGKGIIPLAEELRMDKMIDRLVRRPRIRSPWACSLSLLVTSVVGLGMLFAMVHSFTTRQLDPNGCRMSMMRPAYAKLVDFDTEHTRFASKYSVYLYREGGLDEDTKVKGVPVLFIPGNAGSYKQVRSIAAEAAQYFNDVVQHDAKAIEGGTRSLDFFSVDFNEDITAFHGQTLLDQAEYLNEAVAYILSLYHDSRRSTRDSNLPDPTSVILVGHSMGGIVARTMLTMPNYQSNSINTIITMSAPHARAPVSFDGEIVRTYKQINDYWRQAYSQKWANNNPLWHVTLISIAGGGLDTVVPSDYASLASIVPDTHGLTVFTSSIPNVWTGMDHLAITWCDQFRKVLVKSLFSAVDVNRPGQTKPRAERMRIFKKWYLTGLESDAEKTLPQKEPTTLLTLEDNSNSIITQGERFTLRNFGQSRKPRAYLLPVPPQEKPGNKQFTLLSNHKLDNPGGTGKLEVLFCSVFPLQSGQSAALFSMNMDLSGDSSGSTRLACKNAATDVIELPASTRTSQTPFEEVQPFSFLQYELEDIAEHQFVAIVDKAVEPTSGWVTAEFRDEVDAVVRSKAGLGHLLTWGFKTRLPADRPMVTEIKIPAVHSSLLAYKFSLSSQACSDGELFAPLLRQYITSPFESKYFVNVKQANINLHGLAPFMPPPLRTISKDGLSLQIWSDPTCNSAVDVSLSVDIPGSMGKLVMRYRTIFLAFPLLVVALVLRKQFQIYDQRGVFISFSEGLGLCLRSTLPVIILSLSLLAVSFAGKADTPTPQSHGLMNWGKNATESVIDYTKNDLLLGSQDPGFWFLVPLFAAGGVGVCCLINYAALALIHILMIIYNILNLPQTWLRGIRERDDRRRIPPPAFNTSSPRRRIITTAVLLFFVATFIPYQFAYMVACIVQVATTVRALRLTKSSPSAAHMDFYNYAHSILILMLWVLPINLPVLVVWIHNLAVHWLTPFSSHHNVLSVMPFILLVETMTGGKMIPRVDTS